MAKVNGDTEHHQEQAPQEQFVGFSMNVFYKDVKGKSFQTIGLGSEANGDLAIVLREQSNNRMHIVKLGKFMGFDHVKNCPNYERVI